MFWNPYAFFPNGGSLYGQWLPFYGSPSLYYSFPGWPAPWMIEGTRQLPSGPVPPQRFFWPLWQANGFAAGNASVQANAPAPAKPPAPAPAAPDPVGSQSAAVSPRPAARKIQSAAALPNPSDFSAEGLSKEDLEEIIFLKGSQIEDIFNLTPGQKWMFEQKSFLMSSVFFLQLMFRARLSIVPFEFRKNVEKILSRRDNLRSSYIYRNVSQPYRVVMKDSSAELSFEDLSGTEEEIAERLDSLMEADRRRGFDLERDPLIRIKGYRINGEDDFALIVSQPHINTDGISTLLLIKDALRGRALRISGQEMPEETFSYADYEKWLAGRDHQKDVSYWTDLLKDAPALTKIPALIKKSSFGPRVAGIRQFFSEDIQQGLKEKRKEYRVTDNTLMQAAWGIMLMKLYQRSDVMFGTVSSGRDSSVADSFQIMGDFVNVFPVRAAVSSEEVSVASFAKDLQKQLLQSIERAYLSPEDLQKVLERKEPLFDHLLNFHSFTKAAPTVSEKGFLLPGVRLVDLKIYDHLSTDLTVYFLYENDRLGANFTYNQNHLSKASIRVLMDCFERVLRQILTGSADLLLRDISCPGLDSFDGAILEDRDEQMNIADFIRDLGLLSPENDRFIRLLAREARLESFEMDDLLLLEQEEVFDLMFVYDGLVELRKKGSDGWTHPMMILKAGTLLSATALLEEEPYSTVEAKALSKGFLLKLSKETVLHVMARCPELSLRLMAKLEKRLNTFFGLWSNE